MEAKVEIKIALQPVLNEDKVLDKFDDFFDSNTAWDAAHIEYLDYEIRISYFYDEGFAETLLKSLYDFAKGIPEVKSFESSAAITADWALDFER